MNAITCPNCQTENPEEQDLCLNCGRPLHDASLSDSRPGETAKGEDELSDEEMAAYFAAADGRDDDDMSGDLAEGLPDWLEDLGTEAVADEDADSLSGLLDELDDGPELDLPDWLTTGDADAQALESAAPEEPEEIAADAVAEDEAAPTGEPVADEAVSKVPHWLEDILDEEEATEIFALEEDEEASGGGTDWLEALESGRDSEDDELLSELAEAALEAEGEARAELAEREPGGTEEEAPEPQPLEPELPEAAELEPEPPPSDQALDQPLTRPLHPSRELTGVPEQIAGSDLPEWLADQLGIEDETEEPPDGGEPELPEWLEPVGEDEPASEAVIEETAVAEAAIEETLEAVVPERTESPPESGLEEAAEPETEEEWLTALADLDQADETLELEGAGLEPEFAADEALTPDWMEALEPYELGQAPTDREEVSPETSGPLSGLKGVITIEPIIAEPRGSGRRPRLEISEEQRRQVALLEQLMVEESTVVPQAAPRATPTLGPGARLALGLVLLALAILGWLAPDLGGLLPETSLPPVTEGARAAHEAILEATGELVLVAFDYSPGSAGELDSVAETLLAQLAAGDSPVVTVSQTAPGVRLAQRAVERVDELDSQALGYLPGESVGLRRLSGCFEQPADCEAAFPAATDTTAAEAVPDVGLIIVLTSEQERLVGWLEQVAPFTDAPLVVGVTQGLTPVAAVYAASDRLSGYIDGVPGAAAYERELINQEGRSSQQAQSLVLAQWFAALALLTGALYFGLEALVGGLNRRRSSS